MRRYELMLKLGVAVSLLVLLGRVQAVAQQQNLHDRASKNGGRLVEQFKADRSSAYPNLQEIARRSNAIVIGRAIANRSRLTADGKTVTTDFSIAVQEVIKGTLRPGSVVVVSLPGGPHRFDDGATAFLYAANYRPARNGKTYLFFLDRQSPLTRGWVLTGGIQGQFELDFRSGRIIPAGTAGHDPLVDRYRNKSIRAFLVELHVATGNRRK